MTEQVIDSLVATRIEQNLTQADVAGRMASTQSRVSVIESGAHAPRLDTLEAYAAALGMKIRTLVVPDHAGCEDLLEAVDTLFRALPLNDPKTYNNVVSRIRVGLVGELHHLVSQPKLPKE